MMVNKTRKVMGFLCLMVTCLREKGVTMTTTKERYFEFYNVIFVKHAVTQRSLSLSVLLTDCEDSSLSV